METAESVKTTRVRLNSGHSMPVIGLGTFETSGEELYNSIQYAVRAGYRMIDTAQMYDNEVDVGRAIKTLIQHKIVSREDLFIIDKLWNTFHRPDLVRAACLESLRKLDLDYIDLFLMHWPIAFKADPRTLYPRDEHQEVIGDDVDFTDTWEAMVQLVKEGLVRAIGISNFNESQIDRLLRRTAHLPAAIQFECHPYLTQLALSDYCMARGIQVIAFSPLGTPNRPNFLTGEPTLFANPTILEMAHAKGRTAAQIMLRYQIQRGHCTIPKSATPKRIESNCQVFDFELTKDEMDMLSQLNYGRRFVPNLMCIDLKEYPFKI